MTRDGKIRELGNCFGKFHVWGNSFLPREGEGENGVLQKFLTNDACRSAIPSLESFRRDFMKFRDEYYKEAPRKKARVYTCVPYWGSHYWRSPQRIAVYAQGSLGHGVSGPSIPLFFPLCEIQDWHKAFALGLSLTEGEVTKRPFGWQSFMLVWITMRVLFAKLEGRLQDIYYSDFSKTNNITENYRLLTKELEIVDPQIIISIGKGQSRHLNRIAEVQNRKLLFVTFPTGQGTLHDPRAESIRHCREMLVKAIS